MSAPQAGRRRRAVWLSALALTASLSFAVSACGDEAPPSQGRDGAVSTAEGLVATLPDGTRVDLDPTDVECVPSGEDPSVKVVRVFADLEGAHLTIEAVPTEGAQSFDLPLSAGDFESGPENLEVYIAAQPDIEASSTEEESSGTLELLRASCDPAELEFTIDGALGSEFSDGGVVRVEGHLVVTGD